MDRTASRKEIFGKVIEIETLWGGQPKARAEDRKHVGHQRAKFSKDSKASSSSAQRATKAVPVKTAIPRSRATRSSRGTTQEPTREKARGIWVEIDDGLLELVDEDDAISTDFDASSEESDYSDS